MANVQSRKLTPPLRLGILGGGQLARMLALKAYELGLRPFIMCQSLEDPAAQVTRDVVLGDPHLSRELEDFFSKVDLVTFESEFFDTQLVEKLSQSTAVPAFPKPGAMGLVQDRLTQKELIARHLKTADFVEVEDVQSLAPLLKQFTQGFVLKQRRGGYDGNGTHIIKNQMDLLRSTELFKNTSHRFIAEAYVPFERELAVMIARNSQGDFVHFPLVESTQLQNRCDTVYGPIVHSQFESIIKGLQELLVDIDYVGVMGVEMFEVGGELLINELAPRVHNSGHYSQNCMDHDQFKVHLLAGLGETLVSPQSHACFFAMKNLIGSTQKIPLLAKSLHGSLHWYGKTQNRVGRKMGHLNYVGNSKSEIAQKMKSDLEQFQV